jgi:hypothetical protein
LLRIKTEHERAISEQKKFREEYARSCVLDNNDKTLKGVGDNQGMAIMTFQMDILQKKAKRAEQELKDIKDKHERELRHERDLNIQKEKIIEQERRRNEQLKEELRLYEESVLQGIIPSESKAIRTMSRNGSPDPNASKHKRIKIGDEGPKDNLDVEASTQEETIMVKHETEQNQDKEIVRLGQDKELKLVPIYFDENYKVRYCDESTAYTTSNRDKSNILIVRKDPKSIRLAADTSKETPKPKALGAHLTKHQPRLPTDKRGDKSCFGKMESHVAHHRRLFPGEEADRSTTFD